ncbi:alpha/beta fold hydrolase (plasmid) [Deinococcus sp. KNUC1210]|uniref:alpha/beta fold hydrolase n=1 Tax=Deinococcus sp. KNUC1210 TaxID=2917691 RepID=UPI001EF0435C|nr:alpha/beta fold hydrolase [Deinococcus sp. KNUC1210]ULH13932.1 alpha/beta fold hydrolase [Deinococcus sp. KNUC1210]
MSYAEINGLHLYYEMQGDGQDGTVPIVLLHGSMEAATAFDALAPALSDSRKVIRVDLQAHGRTGDINRPMRLETLADDIAALLKHLDVPLADVLGYSMGGGVALRLAIQHPHQVRKLIVVSFPFASAGRHPEIQAGLHQLGPQMAGALVGSPSSAVLAVGAASGGLAAAHHPCGGGDGTRVRLDRGHPNA